MTMYGFILFSLGFMVELVTLVQTARPDKIPLPIISGALGKLLGPYRTILLGLGMLAAIMLGITYWMGNGSQIVYMDTPGISVLFFLYMIIILGCWIFPSNFITIINEQSILLVQVLVLAGVILMPNTVGWIPRPYLVVLPLLCILVLVIWRKGFHPSLKAILYLWYLVSLMIIPFQSGQVEIIQQTKLSLAESFSMGMLLTFLLLNGFMAFRFMIIVASMIIPRNLLLVERTMPNIFSDQQVSVKRFGMVSSLIGAFLFANHILHWMSPGIAISLCSLVGVQILGWNLLSSPN